MSFYAYVYRDPSRNMEPFYVGKGTGKRAYRHTSKKDTSQMARRLAAMKVNGIEPDIEIIRAIDESHAFFLESCLIELFGRRDLKIGTLLNMTDGGEGTSGRVASDASKSKTANSLTGVKHTPERRAKISASRKGKKLSPEARVKMSESQKARLACPVLRVRIAEKSRGRKHTAESIAKLSAAKMGHATSPETRAKISAAGKGRVVSLETRAKISVASKGRAHSPETRARISASKKRHHGEAIAQGEKS
jgi:hypothetical protein